MGLPRYMYDSVLGIELLIFIDKQICGVGDNEFIFINKIDMMIIKFVP